MKRTTVAQIFADQAAFGGQTVTVCGWARTIRDMKTFGFLELNDGSCFRNLQVVFADNEVENFKEIAKCNVGTSFVAVSYTHLDVYKRQVWQCPEKQ